MVKRAITRGSEDLVALGERAIAELLAGAEARKAEVQRLGAEWLAAPTQADAERIRGRQVECERIVARCENQLPEVRARLVAAKAERQREALARHHAAIAALFPKLRRAIDAAVLVQAEAIAARNAAIGELGEGVVSHYLPPLAFLGLLLPDLVEIWAAEQERVWSVKPNSPAPAAPRPQPVAAVPKPAAAKPGAAAQVAPAPPPVRPLRQDAASAEGQAAVIFMRPGVELADGSAARIGDRCNLPVKQARAGQYGRG